MCLLLAVLWVGLGCAIVAFPGHTNLLFRTCQTLYNHSVFYYFFNLASQLITQRTVESSIAVHKIIYHKCEGGIEKSFPRLPIGITRLAK